MPNTPNIHARVPRATLEASLEEYFRKVVRLRLGGKVIKLAPTERGVPDRMVLLPAGRIKLVELKTVTGRLSPYQEHIHEVFSELGTDVDVLYGRAEIDEWVMKQFPNQRQVDAWKKQQPRAPRYTRPAGPSKLTKSSTKN